MLSLLNKTVCLIKSGMADSLETFRSVIDLWASRDALATDVGAKDRAVSKWWQRNNIPSVWWPRVLATETAKTSGLSAELFMRLAAKTEVFDEARA